MRVKIETSCRYADPGGPHLPQIDFVEGSVVDVPGALGASLILNGDGVAVDDGAPDTAVVEPVSKDIGLVIESKDETNTGDNSQAYDRLTPKKQIFVNEYLIDGDETQAAIRAGYSENLAVKRGAALLEDEDVAAAVAERIE